MTSHEPGHLEASLEPPRPAERTCDVLVVGAGPAGSAAAYWLASRGIDVVVVEKKHFPREKTCGDGLTPRSVRQLADMGIELEVGAHHHRYEGLRSVAFGRVLEMRWPQHPDFPDYGYTITRHDLDGLVATNAVKAGAELWQGAEAVAPLASAREATGKAAPAAGEGRPAGAGGATVVDRARGTTTSVRARFTVVADGSLTRLGRQLGTVRERKWPQGMAIRGYFASPRHDDAYIESHLDIRDRDGAVIPGYGWIFPLGDGTVNAGVGLLSTENRWKGLNTTKLMEQFVDFAPKSWCLSPATALSEPVGGRLPMGFAVSPRVGPDWVAVGDAAGSINPFNGEGIAYGYETGRIAAEVLAEAMTGGGTTVADYEQRLEEQYGRYYAVARSFVKAISNPRLMRPLVAGGMYATPVMEWMLRIMANLTRPELVGPSEAVYASLVGISKLAERRHTRRLPAAG